MRIGFRRLLVCTAFLMMVGCGAGGSAQTSDTAVNRQLSRIDLGIGAIGVFTKSTSGTQDTSSSTLVDDPSSTVGALVTLRYTKSPRVGLEFNYDYARFVQQYTAPGIYLDGNVFNVQANMSEYTVGWVFHTPKVAGIGTFAAVGGGITEFKPSTGGGNSLPKQARPTAYYNVGFEEPVFSPSFGLRASFRQTFYPAPNFRANYLMNGKETFTSEPAIGIYFKF